MANPLSLSHPPARFLPSDIHIPSDLHPSDLHLPPYPQPPFLSSSSSSTSMHIYTSYSNMPPIFELPVELLTRIFQLGVDADPLPDDRDPTQLTFEVSVSHVCRRWRDIALHTPHLWTTIHFRTRAHMHRGKIYLSRNARLPIDIYVDTCSEDTYAVRKDLLFRPDFLPVFDIVLPDIPRWRELHLKVADLECKGFARKVLNTCGPAPVLRTLQLWHVQNWRTPERLFGAIGPPPVVVFAGQLPSLKHIILQGVNLPWTSSPFLRNLSSIEYAVHSDDVRMPWPLWRAMLDASPALERLSLHYSGPRARSTESPPDGIQFWGSDPPGPDNPHLPGYRLPPSANPVHLRKLREIQLHDLDSDYLIALFKTIHAPDVRTLHVELDTEEQDFAPFVRYLAAPPPLRKHDSGLPPHARHSHSHVPSSPSSSSSSSDAGDHDHDARHAHRHHHPDHTDPDPDPHAQEDPLGPRPKFPRLETLSVSALKCDVPSWRALLQSSRRLTRLEVDVGMVPEGAFEVLFESLSAEGHGLANGEGSGGGGGGGSAEGRGERAHEVGANGTNGTNGASGTNGANGASGVHGVSGTNGANGATNGAKINGKGEGKGKARASSSSSSEDEDGDEDEVNPGRSPASASKQPNGHGKGKGKDKARAPLVPILPSLTTLRLSSVSGAQLARLAAHRRSYAFGSNPDPDANANAKYRIRRWEVEEGGRDEDGVRLEREMEEMSARWRRAVEERAGREGRAREPWRMDEPVEKLVWFHEEVGEYDDEDDDDEDEDEDGDGDGEEDGEGDDDEDVLGDGQEAGEGDGDGVEDAEGDEEDEEA